MLLIGFQFNKSAEAKHGRFNHLCNRTKHVGVQLPVEPGRQGVLGGNIRPFIVLILVTGSNTFLSKIIIMLGLDVSSACLELLRTTETKLNS